MIEVLVGMIASGKSTYAKEKAGLGDIVINDDSIVTSLHGGDYKRYDKNLKDVYKGIESAIFHLAASRGRNVVIDNINLSAKTRQRWVSLARAVERPCVATVFQLFPPSTHAYRRHEADPRGYTYAQWLEVAERHLRQWQEPTDDEGFAVVQKAPYSNG